MRIYPECSRSRKRDCIVRESNAGRTAKVDRRDVVQRNYNQVQRYKSSSESHQADNVDNQLICSNIFARQENFTILLLF